MATGLATVLALSCAGTVSAQAQAIPPQVEPGTFERSQELRPPEAVAQPRIVLPERATTQAPEGGEAITLTLKGVEVEGASALPPDRLSKAWADLIGREITLVDLFGIADRISELYVEAGYALTVAFLPAQEIDGGVVSIRVVEGFIDRIDLIAEEGKEVPPALQSGRILGAMRARLLESRPLRTDDLERYLLLINDLPGVEARAIFAASQTTEGATTMTLQVARKRLEGGVAVDNRGGQDVGRLKGSADISINGVINEADRLTLSGTHSLSGRGIAYVAGTYEHILTAEGLKLDVSTSYSRTSPTSAALRALDFGGQFVNVTATLEQPLIRTRRYDLRASIGFALDNADSDTAGTPLVRDRIRTAFAGLSFIHRDAIAGTSVITTSIRKGLPAFGATRDNDPLRSRLFGSADYSIVDVSASHTLPLPLGLSFYTGVRAQASLQGRLLSSVECRYGGGGFGRAFDPGVLGGDHCVLGIAELRWTTAVSQAVLQPFSFIDGGYLTRADQLLPRETRQDRAVSAGVGMRFSLGPTFSGSAEVAWPLIRQDVGGQKAGPRGFFNLAARF